MIRLLTILIVVWSYGEVGQRVFRISWSLLTHGGLDNDALLLMFQPLSVCSPLGAHVMHFKWNGSVSHLLLVISFCAVMLN